MLTTDDFISKFESYSDDELFEVYRKIDDYSDDAKGALNKVILQKGGIDRLKENIRNKQYAQSEILRIGNEVLKLSSTENDIDFLKKMITSDTLPQEKVNEIIEEAFWEAKANAEDKKIKPRTIIGGVIGGAIASLIGGILWGLQMIYSNRVFYILLIGLILLCYGIIKIATRQSKKNNAVVIITVISVVLALLIGQALYTFVGYQE